MVSISALVSKQRDTVGRRGSDWLSQAPGEGWHLREGCRRAAEGGIGGGGVAWRLRGGKTVPPVEIEGQL